MTTVLAIFGGLAAIGWISDKIKPPQEWRDMQRRMNAPVQARRTSQRGFQEIPRHRIVNPLSQTYASDERTTLSA